MYDEPKVSKKAVKLIDRFLHILSDEGSITVAEHKYITSNLRHLSEKGSLLPAIEPKLITQIEAADILGIAYSNFKKLERDGEIPFPRKMVGSSVRYRNIDVYNYVMSDGGV